MASARRWPTRPRGRSPASLGTDIEQEPFWPVIRGKVLGAGRPLFISARVVGAKGFESEVHETPPWPEDEKVVAAELGPYLAELDGSRPGAAT